MGALHDDPIRTVGARDHDFARGAIETLPTPLHRRAPCIACAAVIAAAMLWGAVFAFVRIMAS
jgi:hypothetical protein